MATRNPGYNIPQRDRAESGWQRQRRQDPRLVEPREAPGPCAHHWKIKTPNGTFSDGVCRKCGAEKKFRNSGEPS